MVRLEYIKLQKKKLNQPKTRLGDVIKLILDIL